MNITSTFKRLEDGTIDMTVVIPWNLIVKTKDEVINEHVKEAVLPGFRKGMAPKSLVEQNLDKNHLKEDVLRQLIPQAYSESIKEHKLLPIVTPRIHVGKLEDQNDWEFQALTCEMPKIILGNYKENVKKVTAKAKIIIPGKEQQQVSFEEIAKELLENIKFTIPNIILEQEVEKLLAQTLDEVKRLGLTLDQYLSSTGKTIDGLKADYAKKAETDVKLEFILQQISTEENITAEEKEIEEAIATAKTDAERQNLNQNRYLLASIIRQQKTLDFIRSL